MGDKPSVLMVTGEYPPGLGGVGDYTALLCSNLARMGTPVTVLTGGRGAQSDRGPGLTRPPVVRPIRRWGFTSWRHVAAEASRCRARIIHIQYQAAAYAMHPAANLLPVFLRARLPGVRVVTTFHDLRVPYLFPKAGPLRGRAVLALDAFSHATVVTNQADLEDLGGTGGRRGARRRWLIPLGSNVGNRPPENFDRAHWRRHLGVDDDSPLLSYFGFLNQTKGVQFLVEALGILESRGLQPTLLVVGGESGQTDPTNRTYAHRIAAMVEERKLERRVFWTGFVPAEQVSASLLSSDLCVLPYRDGASLRRGSLLAAIVHGLPIVTTRPLRPEPLLMDGQNVATVERDNPAALADAIELLWRDPMTRRRLSIGARELATRFSWEDIAARHLEMYQTMLSRR